jgi:Ribbon-helix-helix protein, copG family
MVGTKLPRGAFHLAPELLDALLRHVERTRPATTKSAVIRQALEEYLVRSGDWPVETTRPS